MLNETLDEIFGRIYKTLKVDAKAEEQERLEILQKLAIDYNVLIVEDWFYDLDYLKMRLTHEEISERMRNSLQHDRMIHYGGFYGPTLYDERSAQWWVDQAEQLDNQQRIDESVKKWTWNEDKLKEDIKKFTPWIDWEVWKQEWDRMNP